MSADDLSKEEVIEQYNYISDKNPEYTIKKDAYLSEILEQEEEVIRERIVTGIERDKKHDTHLKQTISAFLPEGPIESQTGWTFLGSEPLSELNIPNGDALFGNPSRNMALIVECKTSIGRPTKALNQVYNAAELLRQHQDRISDRIGMEIDELECAICVPSIDDTRIVDQIEEHEREELARERVYVWRLHHYYGEKIDLFTDIQTRTERENTHDSELAPILEEGIELTYERQVIPSFFPSSHLEVIMEESFGLLLEKRLTDDKPARHFRKKELTSILTSQKHLPHYDAETIGERICEKLVNKCTKFDVIGRLSPSETDLEGDGDFFKYNVRGKSPNTILKNLREKYIDSAVESHAEIRAMRRVIDEFDEDQSSLGDF